MSADAGYTNHELEMERTKTANDHEYQSANTQLRQSLSGYTTSETKNQAKLNEAQSKISQHMKTCGGAMVDLQRKSPDLHSAVAKELRIHGNGVCKLLSRVAESFSKVDAYETLATSLKTKDGNIKLEITAKRNELTRLKVAYESMCAAYDKQKQAHSAIVTRACAYDTFLQNIGDSQALESSLGIRLSRSCSLEDATADAEPVAKRSVADSYDSAQAGGLSLNQGTVVIGDIAADASVGNNVGNNVDASTAA